MPELYAVRWTNPDTGFSGEMRNVRKKYLQETIDRAWRSAGDGTVEFEKEKHEAVEYADL